MVLLERLSASWSSSFSARRVSISARSWLISWELAEVEGSAAEVDGWDGEDMPRRLRISAFSANARA